jgi:hypothetical protein
VGNEQQASAACLSQERSAARVKERQHQHRRPTASGELGAGCEPAVGAPSSPNRHGPESGFSPETPAISRQKLESIADRLWLGNPYFAGLSWDARDPTFRLPCRRSRVRIPSAALRKARILQGFPRSWTGPRDARVGNLRRLLSLHVPRRRFPAPLGAHPVACCSRVSVRGLPRHQSRLRRHVAGPRPGLRCVPEAPDRRSAHTPR